MQRLNDQDADGWRYGKPRQSTKKAPKLFGYGALKTLLNPKG
jgi:hypothetical protein